MSIPVRQWIFGVALVAYFAVRCSSIPADISVTRGFSHDGAYLSIVARNVADGRGYVNDANWLLFLNPSQLPMPYHNANPLYPTLAGLLSRWTGFESAYSAGLISILGHLVLGVATYYLLASFAWGGRVGAVLAVLFFPSNFQESWVVAPDSLATGLSVASVVFAVHARSTSHWLASGVLLGLAWLTRSTAMLLVPVLALFVLFQWGWAAGIRRLAGLGVAALVTISPWLLHQKSVWGSATRSDNVYYWLQEYYAGTQGISVDQYWRSLTPPPPLGNVLRTDAGGLVRKLVTGIPKAARFWLAQVTRGSKLWLLALLASLAGGAWWLKSRRDLWPATALTLLLSGLTFFPLAARADSLELRYLGLSNIALALLAASCLLARPNWIKAAGLLFWGLAVPLHDWQVAREHQASNEAMAAHRANAQRLAADPTPIINWQPYFYTYFTGRPAVSPPHPGKAALLSVMRKFGAQRVWLPLKDPYTNDPIYAGLPDSLAPELRVAELTSRDILLTFPRP